MTKRFIFLITFLCCCFSCKYDQDFFEARQGDDFAIMLPPYFKKMQEISPRSDFQYGNHYRNVYVVIEKREKSAVPGGVAAFAAESVNELITNSNVEKPDTLKLKKLTDLNGLQGQRLQLSTKVGNQQINEQILYDLLHLEGEKGYYHIVIWTFEKWIDNYEEVAPEIIESFREL